MVVTLLPLDRNLVRRPAELPRTFLERLRPELAVVVELVSRAVRYLDPELSRAAGLLLVLVGRGQKGERVVRRPFRGRGEVAAEGLLAPGAL